MKLFKRTNFLSLPPQIRRGGKNKLCFTIYSFSADVVENFTPALSKRIVQMMRKVFARFRESFLKAVRIGELDKFEMRLFHYICFKMCINICENVKRGERYFKTFV